MVSPPLAALGLLAATAVAQQPEPADVVLQNARAYTMDETSPWASALAVKGNRIEAVLRDGDDVRDHIGPETRVIDLEGAFLMPGFVDAHVHMEGFAARLAAIDLMPVEDDESLAAEVARVTAGLDFGEWITGGLWEGDKVAALDPQGLERYRQQRWMPNRYTIDPVSENHPALLESHDGELFLANTAALRAAGLEWEVMEGMEADEFEEPTGLIWRGSPALIRLYRVTRPKSDKRILDEVRAAFGKLAELGITEIHDMTSEPQVSRYVQLQLAGQLTARVWMRPHLLAAEQVLGSGARMGHHPVTAERDRYLRWGSFKAHFDGTLREQTALLYEPYSDRRTGTGRYRQCTSSHALLREPDMEKFDRLLRLAAGAGFVTDGHAVGSRAVGELLQAHLRLQQARREPLERYRVMHAELIRPLDLDLFEMVNAIAEVNPNMIAASEGWIAERLGPERQAWAFPFKSLLDRGVTLTFGSDVPDAGPSNHPRELLHAAVNRSSNPDQRIPIEDALKAYTVNAAYAAFDEDLRGTIAPGMLADLVALDRNPLEIEPEEILQMGVVLTIVDGRIVFEGGNR